MRSSSPESIELSGFAFGTTWSLVYVPAKTEPVPEESVLREAVEDTLARVNDLMSTFCEDSEISKFNKSADEKGFIFNPEPARVISEALRYASDTEGAFDPTVRPLVRLWGFGAGAEDEYPDLEELEKTRALVGWNLLEWADGRLVKKNPGVELDLSGIAKGYGADAVFESLSVFNPAGIMMEIGGDLRTGGTGPGGRAWRLGIKHPEGELHSTIRMTNGALATSGDYVQRKGEKEKRRTHIINPMTGMPVLPAVASVSVRAPSAMEADAAATAIAVMGPEKGISFVEKRPWLEALIMIRKADEDRIEKIISSSGW